MDEIGRTTLESEDRMELMVSVAERPPLDPGGLLESSETVPHPLGSCVLVWWYGMDLTSRCGGDRPPSSAAEADRRPSWSWNRLATKWKTRKTSWVAKASPKVTEDPTRKLVTLEPIIVVGSSAVALLRQTRFDTDTAAATAQRKSPMPNHIPLRPLRRLIQAHVPRYEQARPDKTTRTTASSKAAVIAVTRTAELGLGSAREWARMIWITRIAVVGRIASVPSPAGSIRGIAIPR